MINMKPDKIGQKIEIGDWVIDACQERLSEVTGFDKEGDIFVKVHSSGEQGNWWSHMITKISEEQAMFYILENS